MEITEMDDRLTVIHYWFNKWTVVLTIIFTGYGYLVSRWSEILIHDPLHNPFLLELLVVISLIVMGFILVAGYFNRTIINICRNQIEITNSPLPYPKRRIMSAKSIIDIYARNNFHPKRISRSNSFTIQTLDDKGRQHRLLNYLFNAQQAELLAIELKRFVCRKDCLANKTTAVVGVSRG